MTDDDTPDDATEPDCIGCDDNAPHGSNSEEEMDVDGDLDTP